jgi:tRNA U34 5-methylaminomethyl-2-thiouridine-forming methyltransferase MnmC
MHAHSSAHLQVVPTADGSNTIYNELVGENYHSRHGAVQESTHVFVKSGLEYYLQNSGIDNTTVSILEVGFGTGLNFLLTADVCFSRQINLQYTGIEAYPLSNDLINETGYDQYIATPLWSAFSNNYTSLLTGPLKISDYIQLQLSVTFLNDFSSADKYDIIYFDAFAAMRQPEMWSNDAIEHTLSFLEPGGVFVTYAITGNLKRTIKSLGLTVEKAPGAPGKREMLRAVKAL